MTDRWTVIYVPEDGSPQAYGVFKSYEAAVRVAERMERSLDPERDAAAGGVGMAWPSSIAPARAALRGRR